MPHNSLPPKASQFEENDHLLKGGMVLGYWRWRAISGSYVAPDPKPRGSVRKATTMRPLLRNVLLRNPGREYHHLWELSMFWTCFSVDLLFCKLSILQTFYTKELPPLTKILLAWIGTTVAGDGEQCLQPESLKYKITEWSETEYELKTNVCRVDNVWGGVLEGSEDW